MLTRETIIPCNFSLQDVGGVVFFFFFWFRCFAFCCHFLIDSFPVNRADNRSPKFWSRVCLHNMAKLAREATTVRRVLEALFCYFDRSNLWSPDHGLALPVLLDMQSIVENSGLQLF